MVDSLYAVKANAWNEWPFALFADPKSAAKCVASMHPELDVDQRTELMMRVPAFESFSIVTSDDALRCSEEVPHGR